MAWGITDEEKRKKIVDRQVGELCRNFGTYLDSFNAEPPFKDPKMLSSHTKTMRLRENLGGVANIIDSDEYLCALHDTIDAWMGKRKVRLKKYDKFAEAIREYRQDIVDLEQVGLAQIDADIKLKLWRIIKKMRLSHNKSRTVMGAKTLHHLLPQLLPPIDRRYTRRFFRYHSSQFQYYPEGGFKRMLSYFAQIAQRVDLASYVGTAPWATSESKMIDNAIIGYCRLHPKILEKYK